MAPSICSLLSDMDHDEQDNNKKKKPPPRTATPEMAVPATIRTTRRRTASSARASSANAAAVAAGTRNTDVLFGRGGGTNNHPGNRLFRRLIRHNREAYVGTEDHVTKQKLIKSIVTAIAQRGGRFLRFKDGRWKEVTARQAHRKTGQCFRESRPMEGEESSAPDDLTSMEPLPVTATASVGKDMTRLLEAVGRLPVDETNQQAASDGARRWKRKRAPGGEGAEERKLPPLAKGSRSAAVSRHEDEYAKPTKTTSADSFSRTRYKDESTQVSEAASVALPAKRGHPESALTGASAVFGGAWKPPSPRTLPERSPAPPNAAYGNRLLRAASPGDTRVSPMRFHPGRGGSAAGHQDSLIRGLGRTATNEHERSGRESTTRPPRPQLDPSLERYLPELEEFLRSETDQRKE